MATLTNGLMFGPGSQPEEQDGVLSYMQMPSSMSVFSAPSLPEPEDAEARDAGKAALQEALCALESMTNGEQAAAIDITHLDGANRKFIDQVLGEGEVSVVAGATHQAQESVLAGVWRVQIANSEGRIVTDLIEVGSFPRAILDVTFAGARDSVSIPKTFGQSVFNAPALLPEINEHIEKVDLAASPHVINLSLLPHTVEDLELLGQQFGKGDVAILSRGYGNCRVASTGTRNVWWVQYYNSQDTLILNSIEITPLPEVVCAAREDLTDSAARLREILEIYA
jgi:hydrogenase-1 operon protein HyaF